MLFLLNFAKTPKISEEKKSGNPAAVDAKMDVSVLAEKSSFKMPRDLSFLTWIKMLVLPLLIKLHLTKLGPWFVLWSLFLLRLLFI